MNPFRRCAVAPFPRFALLSSPQPVFPIYPSFILYLFLVGKDHTTWAGLLNKNNLQYNIYIMQSQKKSLTQKDLLSSENRSTSPRNQTPRSQGRVVKFAQKASPLGRARIRQAVRAVAKARQQ